MRSILIIIWILLLIKNGQSQPPQFTLKQTDRGLKGYYLISPANLKRNNHDSTYVMLINTNSEVLYYQLLPGKHCMNLHQNGRISFFDHDQFYLIDNNLQLRDSFSCEHGVKTDAHEFVLLPNGHVLLMGTELREMDLSKYSCFMQKGISGSKHAKLECNVIQEFDANHRLVFEWHTHDHYPFEDVDSFYLNDTLYVGWTHMNSIAQLDSNTLVVSLKYFNEVSWINKKTGEVKARLGGKHNQFQYQENRVPFLGQHDVRMQGNELTLFDNGYSDSIRKHPSRSMIYRIDLEKKTARCIAVMQANPALQSIRAGNFQRIGNKYFLMNYGQLDNGNRIFDVFNQQHQVVSTFMFKDTLSTYRTFYSSHIPWLIQRPKFTVFKATDGVYLTAKNSSGPWLWSNGETTRRIKTSKGNSYQLFQTLSEGKFVGSIRYSIK